MGGARQMCSLQTQWGEKRSFNHGLWLFETIVVGSGGNNSIEKCLVKGFYWCRFQHWAGNPQKKDFKALPLLVA